MIVDVLTLVTWASFIKVENFILLFSLLSSLLFFFFFFFLIFISFLFSSFLFFLPPLPHSHTNAHSGNEEKGDVGASYYLQDHDSEVLLGEDRKGEKKRRRERAREGRGSF